MNPARAAALLNGRAQAFSIGLGGERLTDQDVAHAIGKMWHPGARLYGRVKWAGQEKYFDELLELTLGNLLALQSLDAWSEVQPGELKRVARLVLTEAIYPRLCATCHGIGSMMVEKQRGDKRRRRNAQAVLKLVCPDCKGEGSRSYSERTLAGSAKIGRNRWERVWSKRYHHQIKPIVDKYERLFWQGMKRALRDH